MPPRKDYHVYITRSTFHYAYAHQIQVNWKEEAKKRKEGIAKERRENKAKKEKIYKKILEKQEKTRQKEEARKGKRMNVIPADPIS